MRPLISLNFRRLGLTTFIYAEDRLLPYVHFHKTLTVNVFNDRKSQFPMMCYFIAVHGSKHKVQAPPSFTRAFPDLNVTWMSDDELVQDVTAQCVIALLNRLLGRLPVNYTMSQKCHYFVLRKLRRTWIDFDNFWHKCYWDSSNQKVLYFLTSPNQCFCTTWRNAETQK